MAARADRASLRTAFLSAALAVAALAVALGWTAGEGWHAVDSVPVVAIALSIAFLLAEQNLITFEFRRQSHSMTFAGVPLALGIVLLPVPALVLARLIGSVVAMLLQRTSREKLIYNASAFCFEAAIAGTLCRALVPDRGLSSWSAPVLVGCVAAVDQVMTALVLLVIHIHGARFTRAEVVEVLTQSLVLSTVATTFAVALRLLLSQGVTGYGLATVMVGAAVLAYRMYASTMRQHQSLAMVHDFVTGGAGATTLDELAKHSLTRIRSVLRASAAELLILDGPAGSHPSGPNLPTVFCVDEDDEMSIAPQAIAAGDWVRTRALHHGLPTLAVRGRDSALDSWLDSVGLDDAIVAALNTGSKVLGTLTVSGRLTDTAVFTADDVRLLQTLAGHLAVSIQSAHLLETLSFDATHDALTGLGNRSFLTQRIASESGDAAVILLDLDGFKEVNDVLGHETGDRLLVVVAQRLQACLPDDATITRLGGDEFALLLTKLGTDAEAVALTTARQVADAIGQPVRFAEALITPEVSIGVALTPTVRVGDLLRCADTAMYQAKARADRVAVYEPVLDVGRADRLALVADMRLALENAPHQFAVFFQPKVDLATGRAESAEALVRWLHPVRGMIKPDRFVPLAETTGLIDALTTHVLTTALRECAAWHEAGHQVTVAVNISPRQLGHPSIVGLVVDALRQTGVESDQLILEITESVMMNDPDTAVDILTKLANRGIKISLDDFGTGYSSLAYLQRLPVSELKIDRSFVSGLSTETESAPALFRSITALGTNLGLRIVAEGIETAEQLTATRELGCHLGQGYHLSRPVPAADFHEWLERRRQDDAAAALRLIPATGRHDARRHAG